MDSLRNIRTSGGLNSGLSGIAPVRGGGKKGGIVLLYLPKLIDSGVAVEDAINLVRSINATLGWTGL